MDILNISKSEYIETCVKYIDPKRTRTTMHLLAGKMAAFFVEHPSKVSMAEYKDLIETLYEHGADFNNLDESGNTPLHTFALRMIGSIANINGERDCDLKDQNYFITSRTFEEHKNKIEKITNKYNAMFLKYKCESFQKICWFIEKGASVDQKNYNGLKPLDILPVELQEESYKIISDFRSDNKRCNILKP